MSDHPNTPTRELSIWIYAAGYFACYVPYSAMTKAISGGLIGTSGPISGLVLVPATVIASAIGMLTFLTLMGWWRHATQSELLGVSIPRPTLLTFLSGLGTSAVIITTTLAYTFTGVSIVFVMLLMRGGVLIIAPIIDRISGRPVRWFSWLGLLFSMAALLAAFLERGSYEITLACAIDIIIYLASYFLRLRLMTYKAKSDDPRDSRRFFVEEQMVAAPVLLIVIAVIAVLEIGEFGHSLRLGFTEIWGMDILYPTLAVGLLSQGTGIFGGLILLSKQENTFCVPVNRSSSILAGVAASYAMMFIWDQPAPSVNQLIGAGLIIAAILSLTLPTLASAKKGSPQPPEASS